MLRRLTHDILAQYGPFNLGHLTLVFPTRRAGMMLTELLRAELEHRDIRRPILAPQITTLSEFFDSLSTLGREDELRLVATLYNIYCDLQNREPVTDNPIPPFEVFFPWGKRLVNDFSNIDKGYPDIDPLPFLKHTTSAHELEALKLDEEVRERLQDLVADHSGTSFVGDNNSFRQAYERLWQLLPELYTRFHQALAERTYEGARMKEVLLHWDSPRVQQCLAGRFFIFAGFNYIVPVERELMLRLKANDQAVFYWDYPATFACNPKAFKWVKKNAEQVIAANAIAAEPWHPREVELIASDSVNAQARFVHQWLQEHHHAGDRTAIVLCDETLLQDVIAALPEDDGTGRFSRINISKGFPIAHTPVYAEMIAFLSDPRNDKQPGETYAAVIDRLIASLPKPALPEIPENLENQDNPALPAPPETWTTLLAREAYYQLLLALNRFRLLLAEPGLIPLRSLAALRRFIKRYVQSISLPFHGEPEADIQVVGVLETRALDFDNLLLLNVEEGVVPQVKEEESFIPFFLRKVYGLPTVEEATDVYAYNFFRLLRHPRQVTLCYCGSENKNNRKSPSRFIMQMMASHDFTFQKRVLVADANISAVQTVLPYPLSTPSDGNTADMPAMLSLLHLDEKGYLCRSDGKRLTLSPTTISGYLTCPRKFYFAQVCGIASEPESSGVFSRAEMGSFVHTAIQLLYEYLNDGPVHADSPLALTPDLLATVDDNRLSEILDQAYVEMNRIARERHTLERDLYLRAEHEMENTVILYSVRRILDADLAATAGITLGVNSGASSEANPALRLAVLEQEHYATFPISLPDGLGKVLVGGRIDRVDLLAPHAGGGGGTLRIVDYKTASPDDKKVTIPPLDALFPSHTAPGYWLQTLIYAYAYAHEHKSCPQSIIPVVYFPRDPGRVCYPVHKTAANSSVRIPADVSEHVTVDDSGRPSVDGVGISLLDSLRQPFMAAFADLLKSMLTDTTYEPVAENKCDPFCPFFDLCARKKSDW